MFAIYNSNGLSFRNTIDNLYSISNVDSLARVRNNTEEGLPKDHSLRNKKRLYDNNNIDEAKAIYKKMAKLDNMEPLFHVQDIMNKEVLYLYENSTLFDAYNLMIDKDIKQIPILQRESKNILGLVTRNFILDLLVNDLEYSEDTMKKEVSSFDLGEVITTDPITDIRRIAKVMVDFSLAAIPVVDQEDNIRGIVSRANVLKAVANTPPLQIWG